ncbi:hypothetical protein M885DRAFT_610142 [Pelagophyceae sp. CCMP2097]|nr:hypothetical protein M885DRAFT_610142 [Pelagophyceae sp. CCMP2097]
MNDDTVRLAIEFLRAPELLRLTRCAKRWAASMLTDEMVMRSALRTSKCHGRQTLENVMKLYAGGAVHRPSPMRLLRLVNGKRCENRGCENRVNFARPEYGLFYCWECTCASTKSVDLRRAGPEAVYGALLRHDRCAKHGQTVTEDGRARKTYVWAAPLSAACGERIGPVLTALDCASVDLALESCEAEPSRDLLVLHAAYEREAACRSRQLRRDQEVRRTTRSLSRKRKVESMETTLAALLREQVARAVEPTRGRNAQPGDEALLLRSIEASQLLRGRLEPLRAAPSKVSARQLQVLACGAVESLADCLWSLRGLGQLGDSALAHALRGAAAEALGSGALLRCASEAVVSLALHGDAAGALLAYFTDAGRNQHETLEAILAAHAEPGAGRVLFRAAYCAAAQAELGGRAGALVFRNGAHAFSVEARIFRDALDTYAPAKRTILAWAPALDALARDRGVTLARESLASFALEDSDWVAGTLFFLWSADSRETAPPLDFFEYLLRLNHLAVKRRDLFGFSPALSYGGGLPFGFSPALSYGGELPV